jgi:hypothetical protein
MEAGHPTTGGRATSCFASDALMVSNHHRWYREWCQPIITALYYRDKDAVESSVDKARDALESGEVKAAEGACLEYQLAYLEFQAQPMLKNAGWRESILPQLVAILAKPSKYEAAERVRKRLYMQMRVALDRAKIQPFGLDEFRQLLDQIPEEDNSTEMWHNISEWAFRNNHVDELERAYEFMVLQAKGFNEVWCWRRVDTMLKIARGSIAEEDIIWLIDQAHILTHLNSIKALIWPRAKALGAIGDTARQHFNTRVAELESKGKAKVKAYLQPHIK